MSELLRKLVRSTYRALLPPGAKNTLRLYLLLDECDKPPLPVSDFAAGSVLVLAPHMDDEIVGCGGTLRRHVLAGCHVTVLFLTDGRRGDPELYRGSLPPDEVERAEKDLVERRKQESRRAAEIIGIQELMFLDAPDGGLEPTAAVVRGVTQIIAKRRPRVIYLPSMLDVHRDHWAANRVFAESAGAARADCVLREYEAWTPLLANRLVDIDAVFQTKVSALGVFESQNRHVDYVRTTQGLNMYRSIYRMQGRGYAEAFYESTQAGYRRLFERFAGKR